MRAPLEGVVSLQARAAAWHSDYADLAPLEQAARSRSEADWIVGMNATRAATIRLRSSFDGAVSLGRVQTPTLALIVKRDGQIDAFEPETYYLVEARFNLAGRDVRRYGGRWFSEKEERIASAKPVATTKAAPKRRQVRHSSSTAA